MSSSLSLAYRKPAADRRLGLLLTALVHVALLVGWQALRTPSAPSSTDDETRSRVVWLPLPKPLSATAPAVREEEAAPRKDKAAQGPRPHPVPAITLPPLPAAPAGAAPADGAAPAPAATAEAPSQPAATKPSAEQILERARRDIGAIEKALRKENRPYIGAPLDSPQIRMRRKMEEAAALAPGRIWEAPKVEELVNNTGDGARRSRVITGNGTYCITDRSPATSIDMIEKHGKQRITSCPQHEQPATQQAWRTLQD
jgi:hypothetical protein